MYRPIPIAPNKRLANEDRFGKPVDPDCNPKVSEKHAGTDISCRGKRSCSGNRAGRANVVLPVGNTIKEICLTYLVFREEDHDCVQGVRASSSQEMDVVPTRLD
jgi:hypothetical protein